MSSLHPKLEEYLAVRRAMGFKMERHEKLLAQFAGFLAQNGETAVTTQNALAWATLPATARPRWHALRLSAVRGFAAWLNAVCVSFNCTIAAGIIMVPCPPTFRNSAATSISPRLPC